MSTHTEILIIYFELLCWETCSIICFWFNCNYFNLKLNSDWAKIKRNELIEYSYSIKKTKKKKTEIEIKKKNKAAE